MLIWEGQLYGVSAVGVSLVISFLMAPVFDNAMGSIFWFFTYRYTVVPILLVVPLFAALGVLLPLWSYRRASRQTIVERLREGQS